MRRNPLTLSLLVILLGACAKSEVREGEAVAGDASGTPPPAAAQPALDAIVAVEAAADAASRQEGDAYQRKDATAHFTAVAPPPPGIVAAVERMQAPLARLAGFDAEPNRERYAARDDNPVHRVAEQPVSTFSIDVDSGSYSNVRRMLMAGQRPDPDAVRAEEMINYFDYGYPAPRAGEAPFSVNTEVAAAPWNARRHLVQVGIQGYRVPAEDIPAANLVFLVDTSGSMQSDDKLPLLKRSFSELVERLRPQDRVSIVVYAGSAGLVLAPTPGDRRAEILAALDRLEAGGSTNGGAGLELAYATARAAFIRGGVNRVLLATDGDFNVGTTSQSALEALVADQRKSGVALTTLGFGTGNYNDAMAEQLADIGNGNHAYIDTLREGRKVLAEELGATMLTIAEDVKIQVEFNPAVVAEYRLVGYENRALRREDFDNDRVDAGEIGAGHDVTALYEVSLVGSGGEATSPLRYGSATPVARPGACELGWLRLRYKAPGAADSRLLAQALPCPAGNQVGSERLRWSAAVAAYADLLRGGSNAGSFGWAQVRALAAGARGADPWGHRAEFLDLLDRARAVTAGAAPVAVTD